MGHVLNVEKLNKSYGAFTLKDVSFSLPEGCITGFIGVNGAGKTTTIRAILGLLTDFSGSIRLFGKDLRENEQEVKSRIGVVLDEGYFYDNLSMAQMKSIIAPAYASWRDQDFNDYMKRFSLNPRQKIGTLSKGMRMKFALALALSHQAELLIMDEPTGGLDPLIRSELLEMIKEFMSAGGKSVFFSTHITSDLDKVADMLILIHEGRILFTEAKDELLDTYRLVKGDNRELTEENEVLFLNLHRTAYGFTGLTDKIAAVQESMLGCLLERPTIEDIMLGHVARGYK